MHPEVRILTHAVVEAVWFPRVGEEDERNGLAEVVQLQTTRANRVHDRRVMYDACWDAEHAGAEEDIGVCCCAKGVSDNEKSDVPSVCIFQDLVTLCLDHVTVSEDKRLAVQLFLFGSISPGTGNSGIRRARRSFCTVRMLVYASR